MGKKPKIRFRTTLEEKSTILLFLLILLGSTFLSFYVRLFAKLETFNIYDFLWLTVPSFLFVLFYSLITTLAFFGQTRKYIVSPIALWCYTLFIYSVGHFYERFSVWAIDTLTPYAVIILMLAVSLVYVGKFQELIVRFLVGYAGDESDCLFKSFSSSNEPEKFSEVFNDNDWFYSTTGLELGTPSKEEPYTIKAFDEQRHCYLNFLIRKGKTKNKNIVNVVAFVVNSTFLSKFISCPEWCKDFVDNIIFSLKTHKGLHLEEATPKHKRETMNFALKPLQSKISAEKVQKISKPFLALCAVITLSLIALHYYTEMEFVNLIIAFMTLIVALFGFWWQTRRKY